MFKPIDRGGLLLPGLQLWLDPRKRKPFAIVSHAHGDHVANHDCYLATPETIALIAPMEVVVDVTRRRHVQVSGVARRVRVRALGRRSAARLHAGINATGKQASVGNQPPFHL